MSLFPENGAVKKKPAEAELDITPMIDVTFLLLIFFRVTSTMQPDPAVVVPEAKNGQGVDSQNAVIISILMQNERPKIVCADGDGSEATLDEVTRYTSDEIGAGKERVIIKADRAVPYGTLQEVAQAVQEEVQDIKFYVGVNDLSSQ